MAKKIISIVETIIFFSYLILIIVFLCGEKPDSIGIDSMIAVFNMVNMVYLRYSSDISGAFFNIKDHLMVRKVLFFCFASFLLFEIIKSFLNFQENEVLLIYSLNAFTALIAIYSYAYGQKDSMLFWRQYF